MNLNYQLIIFIANLCLFCSANKFHISQSKLESSCDVYMLIARDVGYRDFFEVSSMKNNLKNHNERLHLKFYVMTWTDADILLSVNKSNAGPYYEIALGHFANSQSMIRTRSASGSAIKQIAGSSSPNMLFAFDPVLVEIIQTNDGEIIVNIPGYAEPLMKYLDSNPLNINYFSFGTWTNVPAKWFYDCKFDENSKMEGQKNYEEQLAIPKLLATDSNMKQLMECCSSGRVSNRHKSFFNGLVPTLDKFDDNQVLEFQKEVIEVVQKVKKISTTETSIDVRLG